MRVCFIGNGTMLRRCLGMALARLSKSQFMVLYNEHRENRPKALEGFCDKNGIEAVPFTRIRDDRVADALDVRPDVLISVYNLDVIPRDVLASVPLALNFHDGPLPRYAGLNASSWALVNNEDKHGVTWHIMSPVVDTGDIVKQTMFAIEPNWSILDLLANGIQEGCALFEDILDDLASGGVKGTPQSLDLRTYFGKNDAPFGGLFPFEADGVALNNLRRATAFHPFENPFCKPIIVLGNISFRVIRFRFAPSSPTIPGMVLAIEKDGIRFSAADGTVLIEVIEDPQGAEAPAADFARLSEIRPGMHALGGRNVK
jgi:methionyl-tRNA formyltransferase